MKHGTALHKKVLQATESSRTCVLAQKYVMPAKVHAQIIGQVFVFIIAGLVFVLILTYGYTAITKLLETKKSVDVIEFKTSLEQNIAAIRTSTGSVRKVVLSVPSEYIEFCAVDPLMTQAHSKEFKKNHPLFFNAWRSDPTLTVFLQPLLETPIKLPDIAVNGPLFDEPGFFCIPVSNGRLVLSMQGTGTHAQLLPWVES